MKKFNRVFPVLLIFLIPSITFAFDINELFDTLSFSPASYDLSVKYLVGLFGNIAGLKEFTGSVSNITGTIFGIFNSGLLALAGLFLSYTFIKILTETVADGSAMGKTTTVWLSIRCALSTSLLIPQSSGYSIINTVVMWIVIQGVGLADLLWNKTLDYVTQYGSVLSNFTTSNNSTNSNSHINYYLVNSDVANLVRKAGYTTVWSDPGSDKLNSVAALKSLVCSYATYYALEYRRQEIYEKNLAILETSQDSKELSQAQQMVSEYSVPLSYNNPERGFAIYNYNAQKGKITLPYINSSTLPSALLTNIPTNHQCGSYTFKLANDADNDNIRDAASLSLFNSLDSIARKYVEDSLQKTNAEYKKQLNEIAPSNSEDLSSYQDLANYPNGSFQLINAALDYQSRTTTIWQPLSNNSQTSDLFDTLKNKGWLYAGAYYRHLHTQNNSLIQNQDKIYTTNNSSSFSNSDSINKIAGQGYSSNLSMIYSMVEYAAKYGAAYSLISSNNDSDALTEAFQKLQAALSSKNNNVTGFIVGAGVVMAVPLVGPPTVVAAFRDIPLMVLHEQVTNLINDDWKSAVTANENNSNQSYVTAIEKLVMIGESMVKAGVNVYDKILKLSIAIATGGFTSETITVAVSAALAPGTFWGTLSGAVDAARGLAGLNIEGIRFATVVIFLMLPVVFGIIGPLLACGLLLMVYVPIIPLILFIFGGLGWLIGVIVLMFSAPIICFLMLWGGGSQDNPLLSREAEQFIMQLLGVFFRPVLMVIGLIIAMILAEIGCNMLNEVFVRMVDIVVGTSTATINGASGLTGVSWDTVITLFKIVGILTVYTLTLMSVVNIAFSCIHLLYSETMRVIGISAPSIGGEQKAVEGIRSGIQHTSDTTQRGLEQTGGGLKETRISAESLQGLVNKDIEKNRIKRSEQYKSRIPFLNKLNEAQKAKDATTEQRTLKHLLRKYPQNAPSDQASQQTPAAPHETKITSPNHTQEKNSIDNKQTTEQLASNKDSPSLSYKEKKIT